VGILGVGGDGGQAIDEAHAEVVAGVKLETDAAVGGGGSCVVRAFIGVGCGGFADFEDPGGGLEIAEMDGFGFGNYEEIEEVVGACEGGRG
jgi:hypothetical protein